MKRNFVVLIVEDQKAVGDLFEKSLRDAGIVTLRASNIVEAGKLACQQPLFGVLADLELPDGHGPDVTHIMRRVAPNAAVVAITSKGQEEINEATKAGAVKVIAKGSKESYGPELGRQMQAAMILNEQKRLTIDPMHKLSDNARLCLERIESSVTEAREILTKNPATVDRVIKQATESGIIPPELAKMAQYLAKETVEAPVSNKETVEAK